MALIFVCVLLLHKHLHQIITNSVMYKQLLTYYIIDLIFLKCICKYIIQIRNLKFFKCFILRIYYLVAIKRAFYY